MGAEYYQLALTPASPSHTPSRLLPGELALSQALQVQVCVCVPARGVGVFWDPSGWGSKKELCPGRASWGWCGRGRFGDSLDYWGIPRPGGLLLFPTSPGRREEKVGWGSLGFI